MIVAGTTGLDPIMDIIKNQTIRVIRWLKLARDYRQWQALT